MIFIEDYKLIDSYIYYICYSKPCIWAFEQFNYVTRIYSFNFYRSTKKFSSQTFKLLECSFFLVFIIFVFTINLTSNPYPRSLINFSLNFLLIIFLFFFSFFFYFYYHWSLLPLINTLTLVGNFCFSSWKINPPCKTITRAKLTLCGKLSFFNFFPSCNFYTFPKKLNTEC